MTPPDIATDQAVTTSTRKPLDEEIDVYGLTHPGKVRKVNQDHFLISSLQKRMQVHYTSLPDIDHLPLGVSAWHGSRWWRTVGGVGQVVKKRAG